MRYSESLEALGRAGPVLFGVGFLAPLIAQIIEALGVEAPLGMSPVGFGLLVGVTLGLIAKRRDSWV